MSLPLPVLPTPNGCSPAFISFSFSLPSLACWPSCLMSSSTNFSSRLIRSSSAFSVFSSAAASNGALPRRQAARAPMLANRRMIILLDENVIATRSQLHAQKNLALRERDDMGCHDLEVHRGANRVDRRGAFTAVQVLPGGQDHGIEVFGTAELAPDDPRATRRGRHDVHVVGPDHDLDSGSRLVSPDVLEDAHLGVNLAVVHAA